MENKRSERSIGREKRNTAPFAGQTISICRAQSLAFPLYLLCPDKRARKEVSNGQSLIAYGNSLQCCCRGR